MGAFVGDVVVCGGGEEVRWCVRLRSRRVRLCMSLRSFSCCWLRELFFVAACLALRVVGPVVFGGLLLVAILF